MTRQIFNIASFKTASRCWLPANVKPHTLRHFSSRQRCVNFNNLNESRVVANDNILTHQQEESSSADFETFEPTVFSSEEIHTAGPVNKA
ncbi:hypothetical protein CAAN1_01S04632 [[Candida] anglica]|uniref:Uncharacterized protein n=1 Tax=[Candida] anglica TaxID=148631 RepID=A0ABP0EJJ3_9ASCO